VLDSIPVTLTTGDVIAIILAFLGAAGTVLMLIMNLRVNGSMSEMQARFTIELGKVQLEMAKMRADFAIDHAGLYKSIMDNLGSAYVNRNESLAMHTSNTKRLELIESQLIRIEERLPA
jgi:hypothetical protein